VRSYHGVVPEEPLAWSASGDSLVWAGKASTKDCKRLTRCKQAHTKHTAVSVVASERGYTFMCMEHSKEGKLHLLPPSWRVLVFPWAPFFSQGRDAPDSNPLAILGLLDETVSNQSSLRLLRNKTLEEYSFENIAAFLQGYSVPEGEIESLRGPCRDAASFVRNLCAKSMRVCPSPPPLPLGTPKLQHTHTYTHTHTRTLTHIDILYTQPLEDGSSTSGGEGRKKKRLQQEQDEESTWEGAVPTGEGERR